VFETAAKGPDEPPKDVHLSMQWRTRKRVSSGKILDSRLSDGTFFTHLERFVIVRGIYRRIRFANVLVSHSDKRSSR